MPKVCVPIVGRTKETIMEQAGAAAAKSPDLVEWRADFFDGSQDRKKMCAVLHELRNNLGDIPLLFTVRTDREGGAMAVSDAAYYEMLTAAAESGLADLVDVEIMHGAGGAGRFIGELHERGAVVVGSNHHFHDTPPSSEMKGILAAMEQAGADILKLAVMPGTAGDVLRLLSVTEEYRRHTERPLITMSMGRLGALSRLAGELTGSAVTFGSVTEASAPGQIALDDLKKILAVLHG